MQSEWAHLPNARHIDRVLASVKAHPELWSAARDAAWDAASGAAYKAAFNAASGAAYKAASGAASGAAYKAAFNAASDAVWGAVWDAVLALVAYDDCSHMLDSDVGELRILAAFGDPRAILLLPACIAFAKEKELV